MSAESRGELWNRRREKPTEPLDWRTHRPDGWANRWRDIARDSYGSHEKVLLTLEEQMDIITRYAQLERKTFKTNNELITWGNGRGLITAPEAEVL